MFRGKIGNSRVWMKQDRRRRRSRFRPEVALLEERQLLSTFTVTNTDDSASEVGALRYEIAQANAASTPSTIAFSSLFNSPQTITLTGGQLDLTTTSTNAVTIEGPGAGLLSISGNNASRVFSIGSGDSASLSGLTITDGNAGGHYNGAGNAGGLSNKGTTTLTNVTVSGNSAYFAGGGLYNTGTLTLTGSTVSGNSTTNGPGGGIWSQGTVTLTNSTVSGNTAAWNGGGLYNIEGRVTLTNTTLNKNAAQYGGGLVNTDSGTLTLTNTTVSGNTASKKGGGVYNSSSTATLTNTIIAGNIGKDVSGTLASTSSYNLIGDGSGGLTNGQNGNILGSTASPINPGLAPLADYGGPTQTMALLSTSPAIGAGTTADYPGTTNPITTDQRGLPLDAPKPDIGAFQTSPLVVNTTADSNVPSGDLSLRQAINIADAVPTAEAITFSPTVFGTTPQTITLAQGQLSLTNTATTTITGPGAGLLSISGNNASRVFYTSGGEEGPNASATLSGLTITGGHARDGGGVLSNGTLTLTNVTVSGNTAGSIGGGLDNSGTLTLTNVTVSGNTVDLVGGGLDNFGTTILTNVTISGNSATDDGSAGMFDGSGGGMSSQGTATLINVTVSGNTAAFSGGGLYGNFATFTLTNATVSGNSAANVGGGVNNRSSTFTFTNTIVAGNTGGDIAGNGTLSGSYNLIGDGSGNISGSNNILGSSASPISPDLAPLANYGGPTQTMALLPGSPAINAGTSNGAPKTDQRGFARVGKVDIGAFEYQGAPFVWTGGGNNANWSNPSNWSVYGTPAIAAPGPLDSVVLDGSADSTDNLAQVGSIALDPTYTGTLTLGANTTVHGDFTQQGGTVDAGSTTLSVQGGLALTGGTFNAGTGTVVLQNNGVPNSTIAINTGTQVLNNVSINEASSDTLNVTALTVGGTLSLQRGQFLNGTIVARGNVTSSDPSFGSSSGSSQTGKIELDGATAQTISSQPAMDAMGHPIVGAFGQLPSIKIDNNGQTVTLDSTNPIAVTGSWNNSGGATVTATGSTVVFQQGPAGGLGTAIGINDGGQPFDNVVINRGSGDTIGVASMSVDGNLTIDRGQYLSGTINVKGNVTTTDPSFGSISSSSQSGTIVLDGTVNQTISAGVATDAMGRPLSTPAQLPTIAIAQASGGSVTLDPTNPIAVTGYWYNNSNSPVTSTGSTVVFQQGPAGGMSTTVNIANGTRAFNNVVINRGAGDTINVTNVTANGKLSISGGKYLTGTIYVAGNLTTTDTSLGSPPGAASPGTIQLFGTGNQTVSAGTANAQLPNFQIIKTGGSVTLASGNAIDVSGNWYNYSGTTVHATGSTIAFESGPAGGSGAYYHVNDGGQAFAVVDVDLAASDTLLANSLHTAGDLDVNTGTLRIGYSEVTVGGSMTVSSSVLRDAPSTATTQLAITGSLTLGSSSTITLVGPMPTMPTAGFALITVGGVLTNNGAATNVPPGYTLTIDTTTGVVTLKKNS